MPDTCFRYNRIRFYIMDLCLKSRSGLLYSRTFQNSTLQKWSTLTLRQPSAWCSVQRECSDRVSLRVKSRSCWLEIPLFSIIIEEKMLLLGAQ